MMDNFDILPVFSSPIIRTIVNENTEELKENSYKLRGSGDRSSVDRRVLEKHPKIRDILIKNFNDIAKDYFKYDCKFKITTSWFTETNKDESSHLHNHRNSFYSGVYYYDEYDENSSSLRFKSPVSEKSDFYLEVDSDKYNYLNSINWIIKPSKNLLLFFPSYLRHEIQVNNSNIKRCSLAFNIVPVGKYGAKDSIVDTDWL